MTYLEALDITVARTKHERFRWLCSDDNPNVESRTAYRDLVVAMATGQPEPKPSYEDRALQDYVQAHPCGSC